MGPASAASYVRISGEGSSWAGLAWSDFSSNAQRQGVTVDYTANGSSQGRDDFARQTNATFADSEIPFKGDASDPQDTTAVPFAYGMLPVVAGGTAFMYNLPIGGAQYSGLKLTMANIAKIFSGQVTNWDDPSIQANNPGVTLPNHTIDVVARSDGSGATAQFKLWMLRQFPADYAYLAGHTGGDPSHASSYFPVGSLSNFTAQNGSTGSSQFVANTAYSINYDEYAYASEFHLPVASIRNQAGFYVQPTPKAVAVALIAAKINTNQNDPNYLSQDLSNVYTYADPRAYPMSMYSYEIVPHAVNAVTSAAKGATLAWVSTQALCEWQRDMGPLGYSPLPMNLVLAGFNQLLGIPGIDAATKASIASTVKGVLQSGTNPCNNPTFQPGDDPSHNVLVDTAPFPAGCNAACEAPWRQAGKGVNNNGPQYGTTTVKPAQNTPQNTTTQQQNQPGTNTTGTGTGKTGRTGTSTPTGSSTSPATTTQATNAPGGTSTGGGGGGQSCDADTGVCTGGDSTTGTTTVANVQAVPMTIAASDGWTGTQWIGLVFGLLVFAALIVAPALVSAATRGGGGK
ncbi:MAG: substrate-binding domain-containing protein [Actinomycetia bacterium]|nr:substrate-binding domain-containing protein [Actinomycetes bacterium]